MRKSTVANKLAGSLYNITRGPVFATNVEKCVLVVLLFNTLNIDEFHFEKKSKKKSSSEARYLQM